MLLSADLITADGIGVIIGSKILKGSLKERVTGADLTHDLIKYCNFRSKKNLLQVRNW